MDRSPDISTIAVNSGRFLSRSPWLTACLAIVLLGASPANAQTANAHELFAEGNRLFQDDLYWAALLRYRQADEAGLNSPLLQYNMGVANYKAQQYVRAREALLKASESYRLEVLSHYNLGLTAWALNDYDQALGWFRLARDQEQMRNISKLAKTAISRVYQDMALQEEPEIEQGGTVASIESTREPTVFDFRARVGAGMDSNVYRTPTESYVDLSDPNAPVIDPIVQSGMFIPASLSAKYSVNSFDHESFFGAYRIAGRFYQDQNLENANEHIQELAIGSEYDRKEENRERKIYSAFVIAEHDEKYYDRDNGSNRQVGGEDISNRMNYVRYGPELWFRQSWDRFSFSGRGKAQLWNFEETVVVPEYDHEYVLLGVNAQYRFTRTSLLRVIADAYRRHYGERPAFDLDGTISLGNPAVEYDYLDLGITARQRITRGFWFGLDYIYTQREDGYVGYNDYNKHSYGLELHLNGQRFSLEASGIYRLYDYPNAFAFHNPAAGPKTLERVLGALIGEFQMTRQLTLIGAVRYDDVASNDTRLAYNRMQYSLSVRWENN